MESMDKTMCLEKSQTKNSGVGKYVLKTSRMDMESRMPEKKNLLYESPEASGMLFMKERRIASALAFK